MSSSKQCYHHKLESGLEKVVSASDVAIRVSNLSKCYEIYGTPRDRLKQFIIPRLNRLIGQAPRQYFREFWALYDITFEIRKGETVGIIGRNGSGKSTLLQIICGTLSQTTGTVETNGRIAALLELGSGFNPEFTGRENVFMNAAVLGLSKEEVQERFDAIAAFADIGQFIEQPVKTYSSGMVVRLAFAVQTQVDPDILVVDEALAVGDFAFQYKCIRKLKEISEAGCTVLFVTHDIEQVQKLCSRSLYLRGGKAIFFGEAKLACNQYLADVRVVEDVEMSTTADATAGVPFIQQDVDFHHFPQEDFNNRVAAFRRGTRQQGEITYVSINGGNPIEPMVRFGEQVEVDIIFNIFQRMEHTTIAMYVIDDTGQLIIGTNTYNEYINLAECRLNQFYMLRYTFINRLRAGRFAIQVYLVDFVPGFNTEYVDYIEMAALFTSIAEPNHERWAWFSPPFSSSLMEVKQ